MNIGQPTFFNWDVFFALVDMYVSADEVERALWLLDNPPAYYRDNPPKRLIETREALNRQIWTPIQYRGIYDGAAVSQEWPARAQVLEKLIDQQKDRPVHIMEYAPGDLWLRDGLNERGNKFTYEYISLDRSELVKDVDQAALKVFVAFEIIEHLSNVHELFQNYLKFGKTADVVIASTPLYTYAGGMPEWRDRPLGHLRAYTPTELYNDMSGMFHGFKWTMHLHDTIVLVGERNV